MIQVSPGRLHLSAETLMDGVSGHWGRIRAIIFAGLVLANGLACKTGGHASSLGCEAGCTTPQEDAIPEGTVSGDGPGSAIDQGPAVDHGVAVPVDAAADSRVVLPADAATDRRTVSPSDAVSDQRIVTPMDATADQAPLGPPESSCPDPALTGTVYYVCDCGKGADSDCKPGDDKAAGTSPATAWRTYSKAQQTFGSMPAGGIIAFCRGGYFSTANSSVSFFNPKCQADKRCVIRDYDPPWKSGDEERPIIYAPSGNAISFEDSSDPDPDGGYLVLNLELVGADTTSSFGIFFYNDVKDVLMCNLRIHDFGVGVHVAESNTVVNKASDGLQKRIVLRNSEVTNNVGQGWLGVADDCSIEYNRFDNNGKNDGLDHNVYVSSPASGPAVGMRVIGNVLTRASYVNGHCTGASLVVHGRQDGLRIEGNTISEVAGTAGQGCWGIAVDPGYDSAEYFKNLVITRNLVKSVGNISIGVAACQNCRIENNVIIQNTSGNAIAVPDRDRGSGDIATTAITIRNNSIYYASGVSGTAILLSTEGTQHKVVSNAIMFGGEPNANLGRTCFGADLKKEAYDAFDYNLCQFSAGKWEAKIGSLSAWQDARSFDTHSKVASPGYASVVEPFDFSAGSADSAMVHNGDPVNSAPDSFTGAARGPKPDIGAYERP